MSIYIVKLHAIRVEAVDRVAGNDEWGWTVGRGIIPQDVIEQTKFIEYYL